MKKLPTEIVLYIFEFLQPEDLAKISSVCRKWNALANYSPLWKRICQNLKVKLSSNVYDLYKNDWKRMYRDNRYVEATYVWYIQGFNDLSEKKYFSDEFQSHNHTWRLLVFPRGNTDKAHLAFYLDSLEAKKSPNPSVYAQFTLTINNWNGCSPYTQEASHIFSPTEDDWGFNQCLKLAHIQEVKRAYVRDNVLRVSCYIKECHD